MTDITRKQVCKCENCGNEAEMVLTCTLVDAETPAAAGETDAPAAGTKARAKGTCTHCGNEADMWIDL